MNILVTGCSGQLGSEIQYLANNFPNHNYFFSDIAFKEDISLIPTSSNKHYAILDIGDIETLRTTFQVNNINLIINCAAYTNVEKAEDDRDATYNLNVNAVSNLATVAKEYGAKMIHISTDYVFNGKGYRPYKENKITNPINYYGLTKWQGEECV